MLRLGQGGVAGCDFDGALIGTSSITARYRCPAGLVELELSPRDSASGTAVRQTRRFDLTVRSGSPPEELLSVVAGSTEAAEAEWRWTGVAVPGRAEEAGGARRPRLPAQVAAVLQRVAPTGLEQVGPWLAVLGCALLFMGGVTRRPGRGELALAGGLFLAAAGLRAAFGLWGPLHANGQGPLWIRATLSGPGLLASYGPGYAELLAPVARLAPTSADTLVFLTHVVLSAAIPVAAFALARTFGLEPARAALAGAVVALDPVAVRTAASESYFVPIGALGAAALLAVGLAASHHAAGRIGRALLLLAGAALLAAHAARIHPSGWPMLALVPWMAVALPEASLPRRLAALFAGAVGIGATVFLTGGGSLAGVLATTVGGDLVSQHPLLGRGLPVTLLASAAAVLVLARPRRLAWAALPFLAVLVATRSLYGQSALFEAAYVRLYAVPLALALAAALPIPQYRWRFAAATALGAIVLGFGWRSLPPPTTEQLEYAWVREQLASLQPDCRVGHVPRTGNRLVLLPMDAVPRANPRPQDPLDVSSPEQAGFLSRAGGCAVYVHSSLCTSPEGRPACEAAEARLALGPRRALRLPAVPSYDGLPYDATEVEVWIAPLQRAEGEPGALR